MIAAFRQREIEEEAAEEYRETERRMLSLVAEAVAGAAAVGIGAVAAGGVALRKRLNTYVARRSKAHQAAVRAAYGKMFEENARSDYRASKVPKGDASKRARAAWDASKAKVAEAQRGMVGSANALYGRYASQAASNAKTMGYERALSLALRDLAAEGVSAYTYTREDGTVVSVPVDVGIRRAMETEANQMLIEQTLDNAEANGDNYVRVNETANARPSHAVWQGRVYQIRGSGRYPNFYEACHVGDMVNGIGGYNCGHRVEIWHPGAPEAREDPLRGTGYSTEEARRLTSRQRALENDIRKGKRAIELMEEQGLDDTPECVRQRKLLRKRRARLKNLVEENRAVLRRQGEYRERTYAKGEGSLGKGGKALLERARTGEATRHEAALGEWEARALGDLSVNRGSQEKHIAGTDAYRRKVEKVKADGYAAPSRIVVSVAECERLVSECAGKGRPLMTKRGTWSKQEVCSTDRVVGYYVLRDGTEFETRFFKIHYGAHGTHIVPAKDEGALFDED